MTKPTLWLCPQRRLRSAWASAQSDQSLHCPHEESLDPYLPIKRTAKADQTGQMPRLIQDSDQHWHPPSLIRDFSVRMKKALILSYPLSAQQRLIRLGGCPG